MKKEISFAFIIPSYNEFDSLRILLKSIRKIYKNPPIYIVDDSSSAQREKIISLKNKFAKISVTSRNMKLGRGSAVIEGFRKSLKNSKLKYFLEMDSDLAHNPAEVERFLKKVKEENIDLVIGSRYMKGSSIKNLEKERTILSRIINIFLKFWLGIRVSDFTSGFRLYSRKATEILVSEKIESKGFITLSETLFKLHKKKLTVGEVPITWNFRRFGKSNVNLKELFYSLYFVLKMRIRYLLLYLDKRKLFLVLLIFLSALILRLNTINQMGRTWDEPGYIEHGYNMINLLKKGDFGNSYFYTTYDHPPLVKYFYGLTAHFDVKSIDQAGEPVFHYDYTYSRVFSAVMGSLSAALVFLIALSISTPFIAFSAAMIFLLLPFFIGLSQLVTTESFLVFFFTLSVYMFFKLLQKHSYKIAIFVGVLTGLSVLIKQSNLMLFPLYFLFYLVFYYYYREKTKLLNKKIIYSFVLIILFSIITFVALWPMPYPHLDYILDFNERVWLVKTAPPEVFWGRLILSPIIYFPTMFFITVPLLIIVLFLFGFKYIDRNRNWLYVSLIIWFLFPFLQSFYPWRMHGLRYIVQIYVPLSIIAAMGIAHLASFLSRKFKWKMEALKSSFLILTIFYLLIILKGNSPYFLNYYNELVGGQKGVYEKRYFHLGWWGDGMREAALYLEKKAPKGSFVGLAVNPPKSFPELSSLKAELYKEDKRYDYVVVNYYHVLREGFDDSKIRNKYEVEYQVMSGGAPIVTVYVSK
jgi:dolichol-phosphate mannosyltransferase